MLWKLLCNVCTYIAYQFPKQTIFKSFKSRFHFIARNCMNVFSCILYKKKEETTHYVFHLFPSAFMCDLTCSYKSSITKDQGQDVLCDSLKDTEECYIRLAGSYIQSNIVSPTQMISSARHKEWHLIFKVPCQYTFMNKIFIYALQ